jgi:hypothetical protein
MNHPSAAEVEFASDLVRSTLGFDVTMTEDEFAALARRVAQQRADLERLRSALPLDEEPAHVFAPRRRAAQP